MTYEQATAMLLRTLGYTNENLNGGKSAVYNSAAYKTKALALGLYADVDSVQMKDAANRGDIALMLNVNLQQNMVYTNEQGKPQSVTDVSGNQAQLISKIATAKEMTVTPADLGGAHTVDLMPYLYQNITAYVTDGNVVYVEKGSSKIYEGSPAANRNAEEGKITVTLADKSTVDLAWPAQGVSVFRNGAETLLTETGLESKELQMRFVTDKDKKLTGVIFEEYDAPRQVEATYITGKTKFMGEELPKTKEGKADFDKITVVGDAAALEDVIRNDVVERAAAEDGSAVKFWVTRDTVDGKVTKIIGDAYFINGTAYKANGITPALGDEGVFFLDRSDALAFFRAERTVERGLFLSHMNTANAAKKAVSQVNLLSGDGKALSPITADTGWKTGVSEDMKHMVVEYTTNGAGEIEKIWHYTGTVLQNVVLAAVTDKYVVRENASERINLAENLTVYKFDGLKASAADISDVQFHKDDSVMDLYLRDGMAEYIVISPTHYEAPADESDVTYEGYLGEHNETEFLLYETWESEPISLAYDESLAASLQSLAEQRVSCTVRNGVVISIERVLD